MTRMGFFIFNLLLIALIYGNVYLSGKQPAAISYAIRAFSEPYVILLLLMSIISAIRWAMTHDSDVEAEIVTWANAFWMVPVATVGALYMMGAIPGNFLHGLHGLMTLR